MPDFHQNGVIATLHNFNTKSIEEIEKHTSAFITIESSNKSS